MAKTVTLRLDEQSYERLKAAAAADRRSLGNLIQTAALRYLEDSSFTDESETREILSDQGLLRRLKAGHTAARRRRGSFVRGL
jgi:uncharacterized protein (DUF1778 family)